jgi:DNA primase
VVAERVPYLADVADRIHGTTPREQAIAVEEVRPLLLAVGDPIERSGYMEMVARKLRLDPRILTQSVIGAQGAKDTFGKNRHNMVRTGAKPPSALPSVDVELMAALVRHPEAIGEVRQRLPRWAEAGTMAQVLDRIATHQARELASWLDQIEPPARTWLLEAMTWQGPDGGKVAIDDYVERIKARYDQERYHTLLEQVRHGDMTEDVMKEIQDAVERIRQHKVRKEG